jgi:hypothetical protein
MVAIGSSALANLLAVNEDAVAKRQTATVVLNIFFI